MTFWGTLGPANISNFNFCQLTRMSLSFVWMTRNNLSTSMTKAFSKNFLSCPSLFFLNHCNLIWFYRSTFYHSSPNNIYKRIVNSDSWLLANQQILYFQKETLRSYFFKSTINQNKPFTDAISYDSVRKNKNNFSTKCILLLKKDF